MKLKNILTKFTLSVMLIVSVFSCYCGVLKITSCAFADDYTPASVSIANANFASPNGNKNSAYPLSSSDWTTTSAASDSLKIGIINVDSEVFENNNDDYNLNYNPLTHAESSDKQILMINSTTSENVKFVSNSFTLDKASHYVLKVFVYTDTTALASIKISGTNLEDLTNTEIKAINTNKSWQEYTILITSDSINAVNNAKLTLALGDNDGGVSSGAVFFDNVRLKKYSNAQYQDIKSTINASKSTEVVAQNRLVNLIDNADFESGIGDSSTFWTKIDAENSTTNQVISGVQFIGEGFDSTATGVSENPNNGLRANNNKALLINNVGYNTIGYKSNDFVIAQHKLYKLSFRAKTNNILGTALATIISNNTNDSEDFTVTSKNTDSINTSSLTDSVNGNWIEYSFYISGDVFGDTSAHLEFWLGDSSTNSKGYIWIDNVKLELLTTNEYNTNKSSSRTYSVDFSSTITSAPSFKNSFFNYVDISDIDKSYPYTPTNWTITQNDKNLSKYGIINTKHSHYVANQGQYTFANPGYPSSNNALISNNVLMIGNSASNYQTASSTDYLNIGGNSYYSLSFAYNTQDITEGYAKLYLTDSNNVEIITFDDLISDDAWTTKTIYIKTAMMSFNAKVNIALGNSQTKAVGYAFFDNIVLETTDETAYNSATDKIDLSYEKFELYDHHSVSMSNGVYTPYNYTGEKVHADTNNEMIVAGVLDVNSMTNAHPLYSTLGGNPLSANSEKGVLLIGSQDDTIYKFTSKNSYSISAGSFYKATVWVKAINISQDSDNAVDGVDYGISIKLTNINKQFDAIKNTDNEWVEYVFYINAESTVNTSFVMTLGNTDALTKGYALFSGAKFENIDENAFATAIESTSNDSKVLHIGNTDIDINEDDEEIDETTNNQGGFDWLLVPTIITCLAIILAVIAYSTRKVVKKSTKKVVKADPITYDRDKTIKDEVKRLDKIKKIKEQVASLEKQLDGFRQKYANASEKDKQTLDVKIIETNTKIKILQKDINTLSYKKKTK